jgi:hypothetical protein
MYKYEMVVVNLTLFRGSPEQESQRALVTDAFIREHTYLVDDFDNLPSSGEIWDDIFPFIRAHGLGFSDVFQAYDDYEWFVMEGTTPVMHLHLHEMGEVTQ